MVIRTKHEIGDTFVSETRVYRLIGVEYIPGRATKYIFITLEDGGDTKWVYLYEVEIEMTLTKQHGKPLRKNKNKVN